MQDVRVPTALREDVMTKEQVETLKEIVSVKADLDALECGKPGCECTIREMASTCQDGKPGEPALFNLAYDQRTGLVLARCPVCLGIGFAFPVAESWSPKALLS